MWGQITVGNSGHQHGMRVERCSPGTAVMESGESIKEMLTYFSKERELSSTDGKEESLKYKPKKSWELSSTFLSFTLDL